MESYMREAIELAKDAAKRGEVPVGAIAVFKGEIIARASNRKEETRSALMHAEMLALAEAEKVIGDWRLNEVELYVTLEPCPMCAGAMVNCRLGKLIFGAYDQKAGAAVTLYSIPADERLNHTVQVTGGVLEDECARLLSDFFLKKRKEKKEMKSKTLSNR